MYTMIERRQNNPARVDEALARAQAEYFPKLKAASGFVGFYLVPEESTGIFTAIVVWQEKAHADAFMPTLEAWTAWLDTLGLEVLSDNRGETVVEITPEH